MVSRFFCITFILHNPLKGIPMQSCKLLQFLLGRDEDTA